MQSLPLVPRAPHAVSEAPGLGVAARAVLIRGDQRVPWGFWVPLRMGTVGQCVMWKREHLQVTHRTGASVFDRALERSTNPFPVPALTLGPPAEELEQQPLISSCRARTLWSGRCSSLIYLHISCSTLFSRSSKNLALALLHRVWRILGCWIW